MTNVDTAALDAWLAEHLFGGWHCDGCVESRGKTSIVASAPHWHIAELRLTRLAFSTTGDGMLMVLEAMRERGWRFEAISGVDDDLQPGYGAVFTKNVQISPNEVMVVPVGASDRHGGATLPLAVAQAARAALEAETE